ncbi:hypothetical protein SAMN05660477_01428 [Soonwooa buanensis]|uniref:SmpA / OmlA family protein n=1 Tax=Soonwooa buanensis TaxID=619805 RepID=A0A1T5EI09_9FLAO|nr:hypothetical protein [Soonwooa buanensis]SKB83479.1 hypothetical protein SAMN05660477_01428 [Soonwooa buanensis]
MKNATLIVMAFLVIIVCATAYLYIDFKMKDDNFNKIRKGMHLSEVTRVLGKPDKIYDFSKDEVRLVYYPVFPISEYMVFYTTKDELVTRTWSGD